MYSSFLFCCTYGFGDSWDDFVTWKQKFDFHLTLLMRWIAVEKMSLGNPKFACCLKHRTDWKLTNGSHFSVVMSFYLS